MASITAKKPLVPNVPIVQPVLPFQSFKSFNETVRSRGQGFRGQETLGFVVAQLYGEDRVSVIEVEDACPPDV